MRLSRKKVYAVITGDIVSSTKFSSATRKNLLKILKKVGRSARKAFENAIPLEIDIFRGDSWQLLVTDAKQAVRVALYIRAAFKADGVTPKADTRISIGIGTIDFVPADAVSEGDGEAFRRSGAALEMLKGKCRMVVSLPDEHDASTINVILHLIDALAVKWTPKQARAVMNALKGLTQGEIARRWNGATSQQNVAKHLAGAGWHGIEHALLHVENNLIRW